MSQLPKAFIFDLDGVITDTAEYHFLAWKALAEELGISIDRAFNEDLKGISRLESLERILALDPSKVTMSTEKKEYYANQKNEHYKKLIESIGPKDILPGIEALLKEIKLNGIKIALGSASKNAHAVLGQLGLTHYFDYIVDAANISKGKPNPETFLVAADGVTVPAKECIGVEDAVAGVQAINDAGMFSVAIGPQEQFPNANMRIDNTVELNFNGIISRFAEWNKNGEV
ncbi:beta-phosphoglucomutase [Bacillus sp. JJ1566]|uniref:beta-phosphoglucomutase n=1 Tax=Bacillus sp. JJ1566 TaxID=3122961 RepID=UPI002FFDD0A9